MANQNQDQDQGQLPSPPATPSSPSTPTTSVNSDLTTHLDDLLALYLEQLDTYTTLRAQLSSQFRSGFFSLAQAQRSSSLGAGRRYGEESYDERMKAGRTVKVQRTQGGVERTPGQETATATGEAEAGADEAEAEAEDEATDQPHLSISIERLGGKPSDLYTTSKEDTPSATTDPKPPPTPTTKAKAKDPLHWFGILVPPSLRQSQSYFISALEDAVPVLLNTSTRMRQLEDEIGSVRKELGLDYTSEPELQSHQAGEVGVLNEATSKSHVETSTVNSKSRQSTLASRTAEPRSRVLKLD